MACAEALTAEGGVEVDTQGDALFFAFPTAPGALAAASALSAALASGPISVRVGLHTGTPLLAEEGYVGDDVHLAARVAATGHGGQVVVSAGTAKLVELELVDLGEHRLGPAGIGRRFPPALAIRQVDIEEMDLVVRGENIAPAVDHEGAVRNLVAVADDDRAGMDDDASLARDLAVVIHDNGEDVALQTSTAKQLAILGAEAASKAAYSLTGGHGLYFDEPFTEIDNEIKVLKVAGGSAEVLRNFIARRILKDAGHEGLS